MKRKTERVCANEREYENLPKFESSDNFDEVFPYQTPRSLSLSLAPARHLQFNILFLAKPKIFRLCAPKCDWRSLCRWSVSKLFQSISSSSSSSSPHTIIGWLLGVYMVCTYEQWCHRHRRRHYTVTRAQANSHTHRIDSNAKRNKPKNRTKTKKSFGNFASTIFLGNSSRLLFHTNRLASDVNVCVS